MIIIITLFVGAPFWKGFDFAVKAFFVSLAAVIVITGATRAIWGDLALDVGLRGIGLVLLLALAVVSGIVGRLVGGTFGAWAIALVAVLGGLAAGRAQGGLAALVIRISLVAISRRALHADSRDSSLRRFAHHLIGRWGTQFVGADLSGADFTGTRADHCNASEATLVGVIWDPDHIPLSVESA